MTDAKPDVGALVAELNTLHGQKRPSPSIGGQTCGFEMYVLRASGLQFWAIIEAADALLALQAEVAQWKDAAEISLSALEHISAITKKQPGESCEESVNREIDRLREENARLAGEWKRECDDADGLLSAIGLDPAQYRTKGGSLMVTKAANAIKEARRDEQ